jgi:2-keto-3-deoxy-6-phosphogluconate aldolase
VEDKMGQVILRNGIIVVRDARLPSNDRLDMIVEDGENTIELTFTTEDALQLVRVIREEIGLEYFKSKIG